MFPLQVGRWEGGRLVFLGETRRIRNMEKQPRVCLVTGMNFNSFYPISWCPTTSGSHMWFFHVRGWFRSRCRNILVLDFPSSWDSLCPVPSLYSHCDKSFFKTNNHFPNKYHALSRAQETQRYTEILSSRPSWISEKEKWAVDNSNPNGQALLVKTLSVVGRAQDGDLARDKPGESTTWWEETFG